LSHLLPRIHDEATTVISNLHSFQPTGVANHDFENDRVKYPVKSRSRALRVKLLGKRGSGQSPQKLNSCAYLEKLFMQENVHGNCGGWWVSATELQARPGWLPGLLTNGR